MSEVIRSIRGAWVAATDFDSALVHALVVVTAAVVGFAVTWEVTLVWERLAGYSSVATVATTVVVFFALYGALGYLASLATGDQHQ